MHLVGELACGVRGAENGTARIYKYNQGTQAATWYSGFNAENPSTAAVNLDENGGAIVYVGTLARVLVEDADGNTVRDFVSAAGDDGVEVRSPSFVGADYVTSAQAAGNPTSLATALDALVTSFGTTDFDVLFRGTKTAMQTAISSAAVFYNVLAYGAAGDGVTDDTAAVQNAIDAASAAGGGTVFFPEGTYFTDGLELKAGVSMLGVGGGASVIVWDTPSSPAACVEISGTGGAAGNYQSIQGLKFQPDSSTSTAVTLYISSALVGLVVRECHFVSGNGQFFNTVESAVAAFYDCYVNHGAATTSIASLSSSFTRFHNCVFVAGAAYTQATGFLYSDGNLYVENCYFELSAWASGSVNWIGVGGLLRMRDTTFTAHGGATSSDVIYVDNGETLANIRIFESGNQFGSNNDPYDIELITLATGYSAAEVILESRRNLHVQYETNAGADVDVDPAYETVYVQVSDNSAFDVTLSGGGQMPAGADLYVIFENTSGGVSGNINFNDSTVKSEYDAVALTLNDTEVTTVHFKSVFSEEDSALRWVQVSDAVVVS